MSWKPILEGDLAASARAAIYDVARDLGKGSATEQSATQRALFWAYVSGALDVAWTAARYEEACFDLCAELSTPRSLALHGGLVGTAWTLAHITEHGSADEVLIDVDRALLAALDVERWTCEYDLISGLVGYGVYFVERSTTSSASTGALGLTKIVDHLIAGSEMTADGVTWHTAPNLLPAWQREIAPDGYFNCGLAHGVPGVIALLGHITALDCDPRARALCEDAMRWMCAQELKQGGSGRYPEFRFRQEGTDRVARTAWCYGDPGIAIAGWSAAIRLGGSAEQWRELAAASARREFARCGVVDPALCHGSAGLAHIFNRCYHASGDALFRDAAREWFRRTLEMRDDQELGGFGVASNHIGGVTGVALALLAAVEPVEPRWDRWFLCDLPLG